MRELRYHSRYELLVSQLKRQEVLGVGCSQACCANCCTWTDTLGRLANKQEYHEFLDALKANHKVIRHRYIAVIESKDQVLFSDKEKMRNLFERWRQEYEKRN